MKKVIRKALAASAAGAIALAATAWIAPDAALAQQADPALPGGASSLRETYQDWSVTCQVTDKARRCVMTQQQVQQDGMRVLSIELQSTGDAATGTLVLPFGLKLDAGVTLAVDDRPPLPVLRFSTCLPAGCLVPLALDAKTIAGLRTAQTIRIDTLGGDGQKMTFPAPLKGFTTALDRIRTLGK